MSTESSNAASTFRVATFNASLNRGTAGELIADLATPADPQAATIAEIIQRNAPDILLVNEFDYAPYGAAADLFRLNYLERPQNTLGLASDVAEAQDYPQVFVAPSNTGIPSGFDLNNDGQVVTTPGAPGYGDDALGFGAFPGQYGMALFSKYPILFDQVRTFQTFLWKDMPGALLPDDAATAAPGDWYSAEELAGFRLASKSFWDVPVLVDGEVVHMIAGHPTPPTFDGAEDRNGLRNHDEIRFLADYVTPGHGGYIYDDAGVYGGLKEGERFVVLGDMNADPQDGDSVDAAIQQLLSSEAVDASLRPASPGGPEQAGEQGGANASHAGDPGFDTADFADTAPGNLRADYVLPSKDGLAPRGAGVFWPASDDPLFPLVGEYDPQLPGGFPSSDHRLAWADLVLTPDAPPGFNTLDGEAPTVFGHRGASAYRPEHTLASYRLAIQQDADVIEPDVVVTKDGVLIARHEPEIGGTTDVAEHPEFADRQVTKLLDGVPVTGWWAEDFTLAEIKTLHARERIPEIRPDNTAYNDLYRIPTLAEVIDLVKEVEFETGKKIGIAPETKHPTYFEYEGHHLDGTPIAQDTSRLLVETLVANDFTDPSRVTIQSFELANLIELQKQVMPAAGIDIPLLQLMNEGGYDIAFNFDPARGNNQGAYADFGFELTAESATNGDLYTPEALRAMKALYAEAIGPYKDDILPTRPVSPPVDGDGDGVAAITTQVTGQVTGLLKDAHAAGLEVVIYTLRDEEAFQALNPDGSVRSPEDEYRAFIDLGVDGFFTDSPESGRAAVARAELELL
ncbi:endonuclease/exonuclease/phosphatase family protein [Siccirubricoccus sp. KC 17139]|uniref:glycerophosphodiester phosphodiesterase n=1 Tax=Siccirubricoccus soli TaxID=2899147 RepID=A0ABT1D0T9_9PROT|nr:glycerophosphodiester phosphodiesterase family protein [Siccirubricoccus soli]MCO6414645.1 endonuclease/exonuclease/phosphatase family protein [Siccirubricoccus soli]MCP2680775.1 endonuclease/exonuclease/phosphatase family protein [Siccirubricoccus soli]